MHSLIKPENLTATLMGKTGDALLWLLAALHVTAVAILLMTLLSLSEAGLRSRRSPARAATFS